MSCFEWLAVLVTCCFVAGVIRTVAWLDDSSDRARDAFREPWPTWYDCVDAGNDDTVEEKKS